MQLEPIQNEGQDEAEVAARGGRGVGDLEGEGRLDRSSTGNAGPTDAANAGRIGPAAAGPADSGTVDPAHIEPDAAAGMAFARYAGIITRLRAPDGCPWDRKQTHASIARNMLEEAYEAVAAIEDGDPAELCEELGDVMLGVVLQAQIAKDEGEFDICDVIEGASDKMVRRHPHVFGVQAASVALGYDLSQVGTADEVQDMWDRIKLVERQGKEARLRQQAIDAGQDPDAALARAVPGMLDSVPRSQPALMQTQDIVRKAAAAGFFWESPEAVWDKVREEAGELREALAEAHADAAEGARHSCAESASSGRRSAGYAALAHATEELGDVLFTLVCYAHAEHLDAETALQDACAKFRRRWVIIEQGARSEGRRVEDLTLAEQDAYWNLAKARERG